MNSSFVSLLGSLGTAGLGAALLYSESLRPFILAVLALFATTSNEIESHKPQPTYEGTVISVGAESLALREKATNSTMAFIVAPYASVEKNEHPAALSELHAGDFARVTTDTDGRHYKAIRIAAETVKK